VNSSKNNCEHDHFNFQKGVHFKRNNNHGNVFHFKNTHNVWECKRIFLIMTSQKTTNVEGFFSKALLQFMVFLTGFSSQKIPKDYKHKKTTLLILTNCFGHVIAIGQSTWTLSFLLTKWLIKWLIIWLKYNIPIDCVNFIPKL